MFQGGSTWGMIATCVLVAVVLGWGEIGWSGLFGSLVGLYFLLVFFNRLESRDIRESQPRHPRTRRKR